MFPTIAKPCALTFRVNICRKFLSNLWMEALLPSSPNPGGASVSLGTLVKACGPRRDAIQSRPTQRLLAHSTDAEPSTGRHALSLVSED